MADEVPFLTFEIRPEDEGRALVRVLRTRFGVSRTLIRRLRREGQIRVDGAPAQLRDVVRAGQKVELLLSPQAGNVAPEPLPLAVVYEDDAVMVVNKPAGMLVHPTDMEPTGSLAAAVAHHLAAQGRPPFVGPVTRLDRDTTGLVLFAKHPHAHHRLSKSLAAGHCERLYKAVVHGQVAADEGVIDAPIRRAAGSLSLREVGEGGQQAVTRYRVLERYAGAVPASLLELRLETGRTHQIRVHLAHIDHPVIGDRLYGRGPSLGMTRQALHAYALRFMHPVSGRCLEFTAPLPDDMEQLLDRLRRGAEGGVGM